MAERQNIFPEGLSKRIVKGKVLFEGKPLAGATLETKMENGSAEGAIAFTNDDGNFVFQTDVTEGRANGAFAGKHKITVKRFDHTAPVSAGAPPLMTPADYSDFAKTPLSVEITAESAKSPLELVVEGKARYMRPELADKPRAPAEGPAQVDKEKLAAAVEEVIAKMRDAINLKTVSADVVDRKTGKPTAATIRTKELERRIATEPADSMQFDIAPGVLDPRKAVEAIDAVVPKDWDIVVGGGHQAYFNAQMRGRPADRYTTVREFGAVGNGLSYALGVAAARRQGRNGKVVLFEGDGGLFFNIQELETIKRQGYRILICAMNDGGYGSEFHKLRADGLDDSLAIFGRPAFENIARGFGLRGNEVRDVSVIPKLFADFAGQGETEIWNIQISDKIVAPVMRQTVKRGHGVM